ncbi:MAG: fatty acid-binding protein DegV [Clostridiales bacterium GWB2_37_7]|nr:MAG: fatty acid-binding protein DegV [Clostridiales bacterium GWB2_37_7]
MPRVKIVTDSTSYITREYLSANNIGSVPLSVIFQGEGTKEGYPGEFDEFYKKLKESQDFPTTSQPSIQAFYDVFKPALDADTEIVAIVLSSKLSGTYNSAMAAAHMLETDKIKVVDSETCGPNLKFLVELANKLSIEGKSGDEIVNIINKEKKNTGINITVGTLEYLKRGGRLSTTQAFIGTLLNIKPIIALIDGKLEPIDKVRGKNKAIEAMISNIPQNVKSISIAQIQNIEEAAEVQSILNLKFPEAEIAISELGPVVGAHLGPKALGICYNW